MSDLGPWETVNAAMAALKEEARPTAPEFPEANEQTAQAGRHLAAIHRMHLGELVRTRQLLEHIRKGKAAPALLVEAIPQMDMTQNMRTFGNLCGRNCMVVSGHHNIEEYDTFVRLEDGQNELLNIVVGKLREEHKVIHALLDQLYAAAVDLVQNPGEDSFATCANVFEQLEAVVKSHFGYEETELKDALGVFNAL